MDAKTANKNEKLKQRRKLEGFSQGQLAREATMSARMLQNYEQGIQDISGARLATLLKVCIALHCELSDIITDAETLKLLKQYNSGR